MWPLTVNCIHHTLFIEMDKVKMVMAGTRLRTKDPNQTRAASVLSWIRQKQIRSSPLPLPPNPIITKPAISLRAPLLISPPACLIASLASSSVYLIFILRRHCCLHTSFLLPLAQASFFPPHRPSSPSPAPTTDSAPLHPDSSASSPPPPEFFRFVSTPTPISTR